MNITMSYCWPIMSHKKVAQVQLTHLISNMENPSFGSLCYPINPSFSLGDFPASQLHCRRVHRIFAGRDPNYIYIFIIHIPLYPLLWLDSPIPWARPTKYHKIPFHDHVSCTKIRFESRKKISWNHAFWMLVEPTHSGSHQVGGDQTSVISGSSQLIALIFKDIRDAPHTYLSLVFYWLNAISWSISTIVGQVGLITPTCLCSSNPNRAYTTPILVPLTPIRRRKWLINVNNIPFNSHEIKIVRAVYLNVLPFIPLINLKMPINRH